MTVRAWLLLFVLAQAAAQSAPQRRSPGADSGRSAAALDRAVILLADPHVNPAQVLTDTVNAWPEEASAAARAALRAFVARIPAPGPEFRCDVGFIRYRAQQELLRVKAGLVSGTFAAAEPQFCYAAPAVLDLSLPAERRRGLDFYGYDFDKVPLELFLVQADAYTDVTAALTIRTHSHVTVDLTHRAIALSAASRALGLTWGNLIHRSIAVIQSATPLCRSRVEDIAAGKTISFAPARVGLGDRASVRLSASVILDHQSNEVDALICVRDDGSGAGGVEFSGCSTEFLTTIDPDRTIEGIVGQPRWSFEDADRTSTSVDPVLTLRFDKIRVISTETSGCVSPVDVLEARRNDALGPGTLRRLTPQLGKIPRELSEFRPRFAPPAR